METEAPSDMDGLYGIFPSFNDLLITNFHFFRYVLLFGLNVFLIPNWSATGIDTRPFCYRRHSIGSVGTMQAEIMSI